MPEMDPEQLAFLVEAYGDNWRDLTSAPPEPDLRAVEILPPPAAPETEPSPAEALAKIALTATFDPKGVPNEGILVESNDNVRKVLFLPKGGARRYDSPYTADTLAVRRDITWAILNAPNKQLGHVKIREFMPDDPKYRMRLLTLLHAWWSTKLRIDGRGLIVPYETLPFTYAPNPRFDLT